MITVDAVTDRDEILALLADGAAGTLWNRTATPEDLVVALRSWLAPAPAPPALTTTALTAVLALREGVRLRHGDAAAEVCAALCTGWQGTVEALVETAVVLARST